MMQKKSKKTTTLLLVLAIFVVLLLIILFIAEKAQPAKQMSQALPQTQEQVSPSALPLELNIPAITKGAALNVNINGWKRVKDKSGYSISYPQNWYASLDQGTLNQIQNWNPAGAQRRGGMSNDDAKWDISFSEQEFTNIQDAFLFQRDFIPGMEFIKTEKFSAVNGLDVYFVTYLEPFYEGSEEKNEFITAIFVTKANTYFKWYGFPLAAKSDQILKAVALSVKK
jgi:hypothetical protein